MRLELAQCVIRSWRADDAAALAGAANNRQVWLCLSDQLPHPYTLADAQHYLARASEREAEESADHSFCIEINGEAAGVIGLRVGSDVYRLTAELGYWLAQPCWGRGIMSDAVRAFVEQRFTALPLQRIFAQVYARNPASARVLEKAGFTYEARLRQNVIKDGEVLDSLLYARLRGD